MRFIRLAGCSAALAATRSRKEKTGLLAGVLAEARGEDLDLAARYLAGQVRQDRLDVGWALVAGLDVTEDTEDTEPSLRVTDVDRALEELVAVPAGSGSRTARSEILADLWGRATAAEQTLLRGLVLGDMRQGALEGAVVQGIAAAADVPVASVRRALMLTGDLGHTARLAVEGGRDALDSVRLELFRPVQPMLAATAADAAEAFAGITGGTAAGADDGTGDGVADGAGAGAGDAAPRAPRMAIDAKLDGARIQVHRRGDEIRVYTRSLRQVHRPEVLRVVGALDVEDVVLDGEILAVDPGGRPQRFQETMASFGTRPGGSAPGHPPDTEADDLPDTDLPDTEVVATGGDAGSEPARLTPFFFDCLRRDGVDLLDEPLSVRHARLVETVDAAHRVRRAVVDSAGAAQDFFARAVADGYEGVVAKDLDAGYAAGRRGSAWRKVKPVHTLDLVVLAAEWGSGRRRGWLSNLHLGARDDRGGADADFVMLGKTFKGLTDDLLIWQTRRLLDLEIRRTRNIVHVRPELVVEIALDGVQRSSRYPGGVALRFARVKRYRRDKPATEADTLSTVHDIYAGRLLPEV